MMVIGLILVAIAFFIVGLVIGFDMAKEAHRRKGLR
jgi:hypothetical protein